MSNVIESWSSFSNASNKGSFGDFCLDVTPKIGEDETWFDQKMFVSIRLFLPPPSFEQLAWLIDMRDEVLLSQTWD